MNNKSVIALVLVVAVGIIVAIISTKPSPVALGGRTGDGLTVEGAFVASGGATFSGTNTLSGATTQTGAWTLGSGGTALNKYVCYTNASYNPGSVSSSSAADALVFLTPSASAGDIVLATLSSVTSTDKWIASAKVTAGSGTATASTTLYLKGMDGTATDLSTTTAKVCVLN